MHAEVLPPAIVGSPLLFYILSSSLTLSFAFASSKHEGRWVLKPNFLFLRTFAAPLKLLFDRSNVFFSLTSVRYANSSARITMHFLRTKFYSLFRKRNLAQERRKSLCRDGVLLILVSSRGDVNDELPARKIPVGL